MHIWVCHNTVNQKRERMPLIVSKYDLKSFCARTLVKAGMNSKNANDMASVLVQTEMWGIHTHGVKNLFGYLEKAEAGGVSFKNEPLIERKTGSIAVINGNNTMGYISATKAMNLACEISESSGISMVLVKNSCHFGACGYYANMAAQNGMIGIVASNVDKKMSIPGAKGMVMGHNPFAFAAPAKDIPSVILDISSSNVASLRVLKAKNNAETIPETWISDVNGQPTTDPSKYPDEGALLPMGGHKGYGIAMFVEILTSVILGCPMSTEDEVYSWCFDLDKPNNVSHSFIAINPKIIGTDSFFTDRVQLFIDELHNAPKAVGSDGITVPGEGMWMRYDAAEKKGIELPDDVINEIRKIELKYTVELGKKG